MEPLPLTVAELLAAITAVARRAGEAILTIYRSDFGVQHKADESPVTEADLAAHHLILEALHRLTPDVPVISEEGEIAEAEARASWSRYWLVDPLDGTREFVAKNGEFTVNIALIEQEQPVLGVVFAPALDALYAAAEGLGAMREQAGIRTTLRTRPLPAGQPTLLLSRAHPDASAAQRLARLAPYETEQVGSSLKYCRLAEGLADAYPKFASISPWDTAAGQCVLEQAGGAALTLSHFAPMRYVPGAPLKTPPFVAVGDPSADWRALLA